MQKPNQRPDRQESLDKIKLLIQETPAFCISGPRYYGKSRLLHDATKDFNVKLLHGEKWIIIETSITELVRRTESPKSEFARFMVEDLWIKLKRRGFVDSSSPQLDGVQSSTSLRMLLQAISDSLCVVVTGLEEVKDFTIVKYFQSGLSGWIPNMIMGRPPWNRVRFVFISQLGQTFFPDLPYLRDTLGYIADPNDPAEFFSKWNEELVVDLEELNEEDAKKIGGLYDLKWSGDDVEQLMGVVGGHPHLLELFAQQQASRGMLLADLVSRASERDGPLGLFLNELETNIQKYSKNYPSGRTEYPAIDVAEQVGRKHGLNGLEFNVLLFYASWGILNADRTKLSDNRHFYICSARNVSAVLKWLRRL